MNNNNSILPFHSIECDIINVTPFKLCLCVIIHENAIQNLHSASLTNISHIINPTTKITINKNLLNNMMEIDSAITPSTSTSVYIKYQILSTLLFNNTYQCEISKPAFISKLSSIISNLQTPKTFLSQALKQQIANDLINIVNLFLSSITNINDLFTLFKERLSEITKIDDYTPIPIFYKGGHLNNFLRKCLHSFNKLTFDELSKLYENMKRYHQNEMIKVEFSQMENDALFEKCFENRTWFNHDIYNSIVNFPQRSFFGNNNTNAASVLISSLEGKNKSNSINDKLYNLHKYFDYNLKRISNEESLTNPTLPSPMNEGKIHNSLLSLIDFYFEQKYFDKANQILFECIKLSQSNCDHEALLKCYLWMTKIFIYNGNYLLASQCLSTCLIKSFQNNFHLMHLLSSVELANLNYIFNANIGESPPTSASSTGSIAVSMSVDEKIISHSKNYIQLYKNIFEFFLLNEDGCGNSDLDKMLHYSFCHLILSLLEKGEYSLTMNYLQHITTRVLYKNSFTINYSKDTDDNTKEFDKEILWSFGMFSIALEDYSPIFSFELLQKVINKSITFKLPKTINLEGILQLFIRKYCIEFQGRIINSHFNFYDNKCITSMGLFYEFQMKYYDLVSLSEHNPLINNSIDFEEKILDFIKQCENYHFQQYNRKGRLLLSKLYLNQGKISEAVIINKKLYEEGSNRYERMTTMISLAYCYFNMNYLEECKECLGKIESCIENIGCLRDKYDFYYLKIFYMKEKEMKEEEESMKEIVMQCLINAILLNNKVKIDKVIQIINSDIQQKLSFNQEMLHNLNHNLLPSNRKLFTLLKRFPIKLIEAFNMTMIINKNNTLFIEQWLH